MTAERWQHIVSELSRLLPFVRDLEYATRVHQLTLKVATPTITAQQLHAIQEGSANIRLGVAQVLERVKAIHAELTEDTDG